MRTYRGSEQVPTAMDPSAVAIGIFDGVHRGHRVLLERCLSLAREEHLQSVVFSFDPHPAKVLAPTAAPVLIEPLEIRLQRFADLGFDATIVETFDLEFAGLSAKKFVRHVLLGRLKTQHVVVGENFNFGRGAEGCVDDLADYGEQYGFGVHVITPVHIENQPVSSTRIRQRVENGDMEAAECLLGRPFAVWGRVVRGDGRGRQIGFPTANLQQHGDLTAKIGVYACYVTLDDRVFDAVCNVGHAPTFGERGLRVEVHVLDYDGSDLYEKDLCVQFIARIRDEKAFDGIEALRAQIQTDIAAARKVFAKQPQGAST